MKGRAKPRGLELMFNSPHHRAVYGAAKGLFPPLITHRHLPSKASSYPNLKDEEIKGARRVR